MELFLGFVIIAFIAVVAIDIVQHRRRAHLTPDISQISSEQ